MFLERILAVIKNIFVEMKFWLGESCLLAIANSSTKSHFHQTAPTALKIRTKLQFHQKYVVNRSRYHLLQIDLVLRFRTNAESSQSD